MKGYKKSKLSRYVLAALTMGMFSMVPVAYALPTGGTSTTATITNASATQMNITGSNTNNVINWQSFSIANGEKVAFNDTNNYLNLVRGASKSEIDGNLSGGGNIYLINPNGILFGSGASVNVGNLVASTRAITDADQTTFLAGNNPITTNTATAAAGDIINLGKLQTASVVLEGNNITIQNAADITSDGTTALTDKVAIKSDGLITVGHSLGNNARWQSLNGMSRNVYVHNYDMDTYPGSVYSATKLNGKDANAVKECMLVENVYDLQYMEHNTAGNYMLSTDIDAGETSDWIDDDKLDSNLKGFKPISNLSGVFDGATHVIKNLYINRPYALGVGLFGGSIGTIQNVGLENGNITGNGTVGSVAGQASGTIRNVYNTGMVSGSSNVGGIVGASSATITNVYNTGNVSGSSNSVGGVLGHVRSGTITNVYNTGTVNGATATNVGGVIGDATGVFTGTITDLYITNVYNTGTVSGSSSVGGVVGSIRNAVLTNAYNTGAMSGSGDYIGGVVGDATGSTITNALWATDVSTGSGAPTQALGNKTGTNTVNVNGETFTNMKKASTYDSWKDASNNKIVATTGNAGTAWRIYDGYTAPLLTSLFKNAVTVTNKQTTTYNKTSQTANLSAAVYDAAVDTNHIYACSDTNAGTYDLFYSDQQGYDLVNDNNFVINPITLTATLMGNNVFTKEYDGDTTVDQVLTLGSTYTLDKVVSGDTVSIATNNTGSYNNKNADDGKTISYTGITLTGDSKGNYTIASTLSGAVGQITKKNLQAMLIGTNSFSKEYDGTDAVTTALTKGTNYQFTNMVDKDDLNLTGTGQYDNKKVGNDKTVFFKGLGLTGDDAGNYKLISEVLSVEGGQITAKELTITLAGNNTFTKEYDGTTTVNQALAGNYTISGIVGTEKVDVDSAGVSGTYADKNAADGKLVQFTVSGLTGADKANYSLKSTTLSGNVGQITKKNLNATLTGDNVFTKVYDGTTAVSQALTQGTNYTLDGIVADSDKVSLVGSGAYNDKNAGDNKTITFSGLTLSGTGANNYNLTTTSLSSNAGQITRKTITGTLASGYSFDKVYDGTTTASLGNGYTLSGVAAGDKVPLTAAKGFYDSSAIGDRTVTFSGFSINDGNYLLSMADSLSGTGKITSGSQDHNYSDALTGVSSFFGADHKDGITIFTGNPEDYVPRAVAGNNGQSYQVGVTQVTQTWYSGPASITIINGGITLPKDILLGSTRDTRTVVIKGGNGYEI